MSNLKPIDELAMRLLELAWGSDADWARKLDTPTMVQWAYTTAELMLERGVDYQRRINSRVEP